MNHNQAQRDYLEKLLAYTDACLKATCKESENAVEVVGKLLDAITQDINRISTMSQDTVNALANVRQLIKGTGSAQGPLHPNNVRSLVKALKLVDKEHENVHDVIMPLVTSLQFQDRVRQQMENMVKMIAVWLQYRAENSPKTQEEFTAFGALLGAPTTTEEERRVLQNIFPGITFAQTVASDDDFFL